MSLKHLSDTIYKVDLPCTTKMVLILLANYANEKSECYPSKAHLAKLGGMTERTVTNSMKKLIELGFVEVISQGGGIHSADLSGKKYGKVNRYRLVEIVNPESNSPLETDMERDSKPDSNPENGSANPENGSTNPESLSSKGEGGSYNSLIDSSIDSQIDSKDLLSDSDESNEIAIIEHDQKFDSKAKRELLTEAFERVWVGYGRRGSKKPAEEKFLKIKLPNNRSEAVGLLQAIIDKAKQWGDLYAQHPSDAQFQPHAVRWVKEEKWNDEQLPTIRQELSTVRGDHHATRKLSAAERQFAQAKQLRERQSIQSVSPAEPTAGYSDCDEYLGWDGKHVR